MTLEGDGEPGALIRLVAPEGDSHAAKVNPHGGWIVALPTPDRPRMYALAAELGGRTVHAEGALILGPSPGPTAMLARAGSGALIFGATGQQPSLNSVDYDPSGFVAVSGQARPHATIRLSVDGAPVGLGQAGENGQYAVLAANRKLTFATHQAEVQVDGALLRRRFELVEPGPLNTPYQAIRGPDGWRVEWATPGGGVQTTVMLFPPGA